MGNHDAKDALETEDTLDLLGVALTVVENVRLLVLGPLLAGGLAYGLAFLLPQRFESTAIVQGDASTAALMTTAPILTASLKKLGYLTGLSMGETEDALEKLARNVQASIGRNDKLITLVVAGNSPEAAQRLTQEILTNVFAESRPKESEMKRLMAEKELLETQAMELANTSETVQRLLKEASSTGNQGALAESVSTISKNLITIQGNLHAVEKKLSGLTSEDVLQAPTLPQRAVAPRKSFIAFFSVVMTGFLLLLFVFLKQACWNPTVLARHQDRLSALKRRYRFGE